MAGKSPLIFLTIGRLSSGGLDCVNPLGEGNPRTMLFEAELNTIWVFDFTPHSAIPAERIPRVTKNYLGGADVVPNRCYFRG